MGRLRQAEHLHDLLSLGLVYWPRTHESTLLFSWHHAALGGSDVLFRFLHTLSAFYLCQPPAYSYAMDDHAHFSSQGTAGFPAVFASCPIRSDARRIELHISSQRLQALRDFYGRQPSQTDSSHLSSYLITLISRAVISDDGDYRNQIGNADLISVRH